MEWLTFYTDRNDDLCVRICRLVFIIIILSELVSFQIDVNQIIIIHDSWNCFRSRTSSFKNTYHEHDAVLT